MLSAVQNRKEGSLLTLTRKDGEEIVIEGWIRFAVFLKAEGGRAWVLLDFNKAEDNGVTVGDRNPPVRIEACRDSRITLRRYNEHAGNILVVAIICEDGVAKRAKLGFNVERRIQVKRAELVD